jgi:signal transduction histidine kinase
LERIERQAGDTPLAGELDRLRQDVRRVVGEVRDTLYDLRTDVTEDDDLVATLVAYLDRVHARSGVAVAFDHDVSRRPPLLVERELWRIAQEAITNAERHAKADTISIGWHVRGDEAVLEVRDDGGGIPEGEEPGGYGLVGMRERADAIGGRLEIESEVDAGTTIRCRVRLAGHA